MEVQHVSEAVSEIYHAVILHANGINIHTAVNIIYMCRNLRKRPTGHVRPAIILISLRIRAG